MTALPISLARYPELDSWIAVEPDGTVTLFTGKVELGQGLVNAIARIGAEELELELEQVRVRTADTAAGPDEWLTAGSRSMIDSGASIRQAAAEARAHLYELAAERLGVPVSDLTGARGTITTRDGVRRTSYAELLGGRRFNRRVTGTVAPKPPDSYQLVGRSRTRLGVERLVAGTARFVQDLAPEGLLHGRVLRPPSPGARLDTLDAAAVQALPGVIAVVRDGSFLGVVAEREDQAQRARELLSARAQWREDASLRPPWELYDWLVSAPADSFVVENDMPVRNASVSSAPTPGPGVHTATFTRPFQMHASIGPSAALAQWTEQGLRLWSHTQGVHPLRGALADVLGVDSERIRITHVIGPGCYGHNGADDAALDAALIARAVPGRPVLLKWTREEEHAWEPYGAPAVARLSARLDEAGRIAEWSTDIWSLGYDGRPSPAGDGSRLLAAWHLERPMARPTADPSREFGIHRNASPIYAIRRPRILKHVVRGGPLRTSALRSLGAYFNVFALESFIDELAEEADRDPLAFRLEHLEDARARAVLETAAERAGWKESRREDGTGMGIGLARYKNVAAYAAVVIALEVDDVTAEIRLRRAVIAADAGQVVDPEGLINQLEGGLVQASSWTIKEQVRYDRTRVTSVDWESYPILTFPEVPEIETVLIDRPGEPYLGAGEAMQGPTAAAIANAVYAATAIRVYDIPLSPERIRRAAAGERALILA
jgi:CO/xanthine dehydrogenase Mo-binding subunit